MGSSPSPRASKTRRSRPLRTGGGPEGAPGAIVDLLALRQRRFLVVAVTHQPVLPLAGITVVPDRRVERDVAAQSPVYVHDVLLADSEPARNGCDLVRPHIAFFQGRDAALGLAEIEEQLLLVGGRPHLDQRPRAK